MLRKKPYLKILAHKPDIFSAFPAEVLDEQAADRLLQIPRLAVAEIAGPADMPALRELLKHHRPDGLLPTLSYTGTEYGDWAQLGTMAAALKKTFEKELNIYVAEPVVLGSPALWKALREAHVGELKQRFGVACPCLGCRLYSCVLRVPLCKKIDARFFIPSVHGLIQRGCPAHTSPIERKYLTYLMSGYGIDMWHQGLHHEQPCDEGHCMSCVLTPQTGNGMPLEKLTRYFESFALPAAGGILSLAVSGAKVDYARIISQAARQNKTFVKSEK
ncbi:MAG: hypothetical protein JW832_12590 [Deltaproteobacteria bacterium]|nr:hypothetical protein [Deltaproteobacteria bacterium]